jgi:signal transduction histidine kinase
VLSCSVEGEPRILADRHLLAGTLANLLDNAFKYAGAGAHVDLRAARQGQQVLIIVQDDGPGVAPAALPRITERFFRAGADSAHPRGSGLGLSIAEAVVSLHRGQLTLENTAPGLEVSLLLPAAV